MTFALSLLVPTFPTIGGVLFSLCCGYFVDFSVVWMVSVLDYGWVVSSWYRLIFLALCFPVYRGIFIVLRAI